MQPMAILQDWCQWLGISDQRSVLIMGIPEDCNDQEFQETVSIALKPLGRHRVLGKVYRPEINANIALVEFAESLNWALVPQQIQGKGGPWSTIVSFQGPDLESEEGSAFPDAQGQALAGGARQKGAERWSGEITASSKEGAAAEAGTSAAGEMFGTGEVAGPPDWAKDEDAGEAGVRGDEESDEEGAAGDSGAAAGVDPLSMTVLAREMSTAMEVGTAGTAGWAGAMVREEAMQEGTWTQQWRQAPHPVLESYTYQELRTFSGLRDVEHCNQEFESWLHHANDMMSLWRHVPERERRRRLLECLGGPALDVAFNLLARNPNIRVQDCLVTLVQVFGSQDPQMTARLTFVTCAQRPQETLFAYVVRLEGLLQVAVEKGAINPAVVNQVRARQVLMQARPNDKMGRKLRRLRLERRPPSFVGMLQLIRETEAWEAGRMSEEAAAACLASEDFCQAFLREGAQGPTPGPGHGAESAFGAGGVAQLEGAPAAASRAPEGLPLDQVASAAVMSCQPEGMAWAGGHESSEGAAGKKSGSKAGKKGQPHGPARK